MNESFRIKDWIVARRLEHLTLLLDVLSLSISNIISFYERDIQDMMMLMMEVSF